MKIRYEQDNDFAEGSNILVEFDNVQEAMEEISFAASTMLFEYMRQIGVPPKEKETVTNFIEILASYVGNYNAEGYQAYYDITNEDEDDAGDANFFYHIMEDVYKEWLEKSGYSEKKLFALFTPKMLTKAQYDLDLQKTADGFEFVLTEHATGKKISFGTAPSDDEEDEFTLHMPAMIFFDRLCDAKKLDADRYNPFRNNRIKSPFSQEG